ncbi:MAG: hypothetical protein ACJ74Y_07520 [Bryobacteraceae bacterium]
MRRTFVLYCGAVLAATFVTVKPSKAQMIVKLNPETVAEFDRYAKSVEAELSRRWDGQANFISVEDDPADKRKVMEGELLVRTPKPDAKPVTVTDGLIHDWVGTVFIPDTDPARVMAVLRDFDKHKKIYPEIADSKTLAQNGDKTVGYWRVKQRRGLVPVILDVEQTAYYRKLAPGKWNCRAYARKITEIDSGPFSGKRKFPEGEGHGYMWRMYAYWSIEQVNGGVLADCRMLSLSRSIPQAIAWAVAPYVQKAPQESLTSTLKQTRDATTKPKSLDSTIRGIQHTGSNPAVGFGLLLGG